MRRTQHGFTLMETLIAVGIASVLGLMVATLVFQAAKTFTRANGFAELELESLVGEKFLSRYLREASLSFNVVSAADDSGKNFFDLLNDVPQNDLPPADRTRQLTMRPGGTTRLRLIVNARGSEVGRYSPNYAFEEVPSTDATNETSGTITYAGVNARGMIQAKDGWLPGENFLFYSPITLRPPATGASFASKTPYRYMAMVGRVNGMDLAPDFFGGAVSNIHPADPSVSYASFDEFLRRLPVSAGGIAVVNYRRVQMIELSLREHPLTKKPALWSQAWSGGSFIEEPHLIATRVKQLVLKRPNISLPLVSYELELERSTHETTGP